MFGGFLFAICTLLFAWINGRQKEQKANGKKATSMKVKVGFGFDVHQLKDGHPFILGGVQLEHHAGAFGHSDADVLVHAICDAILGAANLEDIGYHFPNTDERWRGVRSLLLLEECVKLLATKGWALGNIDAMLCLEAPKIKPYIPAMKR